MFSFDSVGKYQKCTNEVDMKFRYHGKLVETATSNWISCCMPLQPTVVNVGVCEVKKCEMKER